VLPSPSFRLFASAPESVEAHPELDLVTNAGDAELHPEVRALERAGGVASALVALALRAGIRTALPALELQLDRLRHAKERQVALDHLGVIAFELHARGAKGHGGKFRHVEEVRGLQMLVAR